MARIEELLTNVDDPSLRNALEKEVAELKQRTPFGLVFERHRPESIMLGKSVGVREGDIVQLRTEPLDKRRFEVLSASGSKASIKDQEEGPDGAVLKVAREDLLVVKQFDHPVYPALTSLGGVKQGNGKSPHIAIKGENFHTLQVLRFTHPKRFDCIYIDPPYNKGTRDWKYNNDFVDDNDRYRSSKWLAFMEKRLRLAKELLKPDGVLIVTIDQNELHHLGALLERQDLYRNAMRQMVTICINPPGAGGEGLSRVEEYAVFCFMGGAQPAPVADDMLSSKTDAEEAGEEPQAEELSWEGLRRGGNAWYRDKRRNLCYPIILSDDESRIVGTGQPLEGDDEDARVDTIDGKPVAWPVRSDGKLGIWRVDGPKLEALAEKGYAYVSSKKRNPVGTLSFKYLLSGKLKAIENGTIEITGKGDRGQVLGRVSAKPRTTAKTMWNRARHNAGRNGGTQLLTELLGERDVFQNPKSVYAVMDCLEVAVGDRPDALILDFFAGSGTTLHSTCLLNAADGGTRRCFLVTNNEVGDELAQELNIEGLFTGDEDYERHGIFEAATRPRIEAAVTGSRADGHALEGNYLDGRDLMEGFDETVEFLRLDYLDPEVVEVGSGLGGLGPLLWLKAGAKSSNPGELAKDAFVVDEEAGFAVLFDETAWRDFIAVVGPLDAIEHVFIVTNYDDGFAAMATEFFSRRNTMLPRDYLQWFQRNAAERRE